MKVIYPVVLIAAGAPHGLTYLVGDDSEGVAAVFDPRPDVDYYLELAHKKQVSITHIFETHIHAHLVSGARELHARVGTAKVFVSHEGGARYGFDHEKIKAGDTFKLGSVLITVRHTPGHTPEHVAYSLAEKDHPDAPWGVLTGTRCLSVPPGGPTSSAMPRRNNWLSSSSTPCAIFTSSSPMA